MSVLREAPFCDESGTDKFLPSFWLGNMAPSRKVTVASFKPREQLLESQAAFRSAQQSLCDEVLTSSITPWIPFLFSRGLLSIDLKQHTTSLITMYLNFTGWGGWYIFSKRLIICLLRGRLFALVFPTSVAIALRAHVARGKPRPFKHGPPRTRPRRWGEAVLWARDRTVLMFIASYSYLFLCVRRESSKVSAEVPPRWPARNSASRRHHSALRATDWVSYLVTSRFAFVYDDRVGALLPVSILLIAVSFWYSYLTFVLFLPIVPCITSVCQLYDSDISISQRLLQDPMKVLPGNNVTWSPVPIE